MGLLPQDSEGPLGMCGGQGWPERAARALGAEVQVAENCKRVGPELALLPQPASGCKPGLEPSFSLVPSCLDSLASRHFPGLLGGQPLDSLCTRGDWHLPGLTLYGNLFFSAPLKVSKMPGSRSYVDMGLPSSIRKTSQATSLFILKAFKSLLRV